MSIKELQEKSVTELKKALQELLVQQLKLRIRKGTEQSLKSHHFRQVRRNIARLKTIIRQKVQYE